MTRSQIILMHIAAILFIVGICDAIIGVNMRDTAFFAAGIFEFVFSAFTALATFSLKRSMRIFLAVFNTVLVISAVIFGFSQGMFVAPIAGTAALTFVLREYKLLGQAKATR